MSDFEQPVEPMSRAEAILRKYGDVTPMSRVEDLLKELVDESGGSDVTVTPVLSDGVRLATIGVDGTDYNIYAPEDVVGSIVSVTTEYNTGTLLATITVNDVDHYIYVPEANNILSGTNTPSANVGEDNDIFIKYDGVDTESTYTQIDSFEIGRFVYDTTRTVDLSPDYYHIKITSRSGLGYAEKIVLKSDIYPTGSVYIDNTKTSATFTINGNTISVHKNGVDATTYTISASTILESTPTGVNTPYAKLKGTWFPFPDNEGTEVIANPEDAATGTLTKLSVDGDVYEIPEGTEVIANPEDTPTETLNTVEIDGTIYDLPSGGGGGNLYGTDNPTSDLGDNGDIYMQYSAIGEEMDYETIWTGSVTSSQWLTPVQIGTINPSEYYRIKINGAYSKLVSELPEYGSGAEWNPSGHMWIYTRDNGTTLWLYSESGYTSTVTKVDATVYDERAVNKIEKTYCKIKNGWHEFGSVNYSTDEQVIGTWIDGKPLYQITRKIENDELWADGTYYGLIGVTDIDFATVREATFVDPSNSVYASLPYRIPSTNNYIEVSINTIDSVERLMIRSNTTFSATTGRYIVATIIYTKTTD